MGLFPFAGTISSMLNPSRVNAACGRWPESFWRRSALAMHLCRSVPSLQLSVFSRLTHLRSLSHPRASNRRPAGRAAGYGQWASLSHRRASATAALRRWMFPTVERGPPAFRPAPVAACSEQSVFPRYDTHGSRAGESPFSLRSVMNRVAQKVVSGGLAAGLTLAVALSADAQQARSGAWTQNAPEGEWHMTGRDHSLQRFSPLKQITTSNVAELRPVWSFSTGTLRGHEGNPLVIGNVMYVHTSFPNIVYALDLSKPGAPLIWKHVPNQSPDAIPIACCDLVNRGLAYHPSGKLYIELLAGELLGPQQHHAVRCEQRLDLLQEAPVLLVGQLVHPR